jgi:mannose-binding lectin 1
MFLGVTAVACLATVAVVAAAVPHHSLRGHIIPHHSLEKPFIADWWQEGIPHWDMGADTVATTDFIRLTPQRPSSWGWLWNTQPNENPNWELTAKFNVRSKHNPGADGIAFWYVDEPHKGTKAGPLMGMRRRFKGIGMVFDSYDNDNMRDNPVGLFIDNVEGDTNTWSTDHDLIDQAKFRCLYEYRNTAPVEMVMTYLNRRLSVAMHSTLFPSEVTQCGEVNDIEIPTGYYFGATASTGGVADNHDVVAMQLRPLGEPAADQPEQPHHRTPKHFNHQGDTDEKQFWAEKGKEHEKEPANPDHM